MKHHLAVVCVLPDESGRIKGYYNLSNDSISRDIVQPDIQKKMPRAYLNLPVNLLGRSAVDNAFQKQGLGKQLLLDALHRCAGIAETEIGSMAVVAIQLIGKLNRLMNNTALFFCRCVAACSFP